MYRSERSIIQPIVDVRKIDCNINLNVQPIDTHETVSVIELDNELKSITVKNINEKLNIYCKVIYKIEGEDNVFKVLEGDFILADNKKLLVL